MNDTERSQVVNFTAPASTGTLRLRPSTPSGAFTDSIGWLWDVPLQGPLGGGDYGRYGVQCVQAGDTLPAGTLSGDTLSEDTQAGSAPNLQSSVGVLADPVIVPRFGRFIAARDEEK